MPAGLIQGVLPDAAWNPRACWTGTKGGRTGTVAGVEGGEEREPCGGPRRGDDIDNDDDDDGAVRGRACAFWVALGVEVADADDEVRGSGVGWVEFLVVFLVVFVAGVGEGPFLRGTRFPLDDGSLVRVRS